METIIKVLSAYWKQLAVLLIFTILYGLVVHYKNSAKEAEANLLKITVRLQEYAISEAKRVDAANKKGASDLEENIQTNLNNIQMIGALYGKTIDAKQNDIDRYRNDLASKLQLQPSLPSYQTNQNDQGQSTESHGDSTVTGRSEPEKSLEFWKSAYEGCHQYLQLTKQAGAVCAADYNSCYSYVKSQQAIIGVEDGLNTEPYIPDTVLTTP